MKRDWLFGEPQPIQACIRCVSEATGITVAQITGESRRAAIVKARHAAMYLAHRQFGKSSTQIGIAFGGRDHTTVIAAVRNVEARPHLYPLIEVSE